MLKNKRICAAILVLFFLLRFPVPVFAAGGADTGEEVSLTVSYQDDGEPVAAVPFQLYYVAETGPDAGFTLTGDFKNYPVRINGLDSDAWRALAETLAGYVQRDKLTPLDSGKTDRNGRVIFPDRQKHLSAGLYLVTADPVSTEDYSYTTEPFLVSLPDWEKSSGTWKYDVSVVPKYTRTPNSSQDETVERKVLKVWKDDGAAAERPEEITVQLLKDGEIYDTVQLNEGCEWKHLWTDLPKYENGRPVTWRVTEQPVDRYTVSVTQEGITFVVTNTGGQPGSDVPPPPNPGTGTKLPQTGLLWWPVPVLAVAGLAFLALGAAFRKKKDHE